MHEEYQRATTLPEVVKNVMLLKVLYDYVLCWMLSHITQKLQEALQLGMENQANQIFLALYSYLTVDE